MTPRRTARTAAAIVRAARNSTADPNDIEKRKAYVNASFNLDSTAAAIVQIADRADQAMAALRAVHAVRPTNWDDDEDPEQVAAWRAVEAALDDANTPAPPPPAGEVAAKPTGALSASTSPRPAP